MRVVDGGLGLPIYGSLPHIAGDPDDSPNGFSSAMSTLMVLPSTCSPDRYLRAKLSFTIKRIVS